MINILTVTLLSRFVPGLIFGGVTLPLSLLGERESVTPLKPCHRGEEDLATWLLNGWSLGC
jgi:hypothetical protein